MWKKIHLFLVPHSHNNHKPHILRTPAIAAFSIGILVLEAVFLSFTLFFFPGNNFLAAVLSSVLVEKTNESRLADHAGSLAVNPVLVAAAEAKAKDMATRGYFSHNTPEGLEPWYWLGQAGYHYSYAGENLAVNFVDSEDVINGWMNSPLHRANILNSNFTEIGIATASGVYQGREAIFVVQFFGTPQAENNFFPIVSAASLEKEAPSSIASNVKGASEASSSAAPSKTENSQKQSESKPIQKSTAESRPVGVSTTPETSPSTPESSFVSTGIPAPTISIEPPGFLERIAVQPRTVFNYVFGILLALFLVALVLKIFVHVHIQYPVLVANGVMVVGALAFFIFANQYLSLTYAQIF